RPHPRPPPFPYTTLFRSVDNPGPALAAHVQGRLFESLWQSRAGADSRPHFGLGLYIVRLIAEFHGGEASAVNLPDGSGARFVVRSEEHTSELQSLAYLVC